MAPLMKPHPAESAGCNVSADHGICRCVGKPASWMAFLCAAITAAVVLLATAHAIVIGSDDRTELEERELEEFAAIGVVASGDVPRGTAFLVCDCLTVVTAAHLAIDGYGHLPDQGVEFLHDRHQGTPHLFDKATVSLAASARPGSYDPQTDWLIARLVRPVPDCLPLQYKVPDRVEGWKTVSMIGFQSDLGAKRISRECSTSAVLADKGLLIHMCDGAAGSSGSPLLITDGTDLHPARRAVAIQSGEARYLGFNVAVLFSGEFEKALGKLVTSCDAAVSPVALR